MPDYSKSYYGCDEVSLVCPVEATVLGYYPNLGVNATLAAGFGLCALVTAALGIWKKTWSYTAAVSAGCALEAAGMLFSYCVYRWDCGNSFVGSKWVTNYF